MHLVSRASRSVAAVVAILCASSNLHAQVIFDTNNTGTLLGQGLPAGTGLGQGVHVATATTITHMAFYGVTPGANYKFFIMDGTKSSMLFSQSTWVDPMGGPIQSNPFSFNLSAGTNYYFGFVTDAVHDSWVFYPAQGFSQSGISTFGFNTYYNGYANPVDDGVGGASTLAFALSGHATVDVDDSGTPNTTPEPGSILLLGSGLLGLVPVVRRKVQR